jgi:hypothetical protein
MGSIAAVALALLSGCGGTAVSLSTHPSATPEATANAATLRVLVSRGCPSAVGPATDVANPGTGLDRQLVPPNPQGALVCRFRPKLGTSPGGDRPLYRSTRLDGQTARHLAGVVDAIGTATPSGVANCPADFDSASVIAFAYPDRPDVDLWFHDSGCPTLDNGRLTAYMVGNPSFYGSFEPLIEQLSPQGG